MVNFDKDKYLSVAKGTLALRERVEQVAQQVSGAGYSEVYLIASGGSYAMFEPLAYYLRTKSTLRSHHLIASELMASGDAHLGKGSVCVFTSSSGTTQETVAAAEYCRQRGATTVCISGDAETPFAKNADYAIINDMDDFSAADADYTLLYMLVFALMREHGDFADYDKLYESLQALPKALVGVKENCDAFARSLAEKLAASEFTMVVGGGPLWGEAYMYAMCILEEMQWLRCQAVRCSEFFHGALELSDKGIELLVLVGESDSRPLDERVARFGKKYANSCTVIDTTAYELPGVDAAIRPLLSPIVITAILDRVSIHLEKVTGHSLDIRSFYKKVEY